MIDPKYADLPGIANDQPDVYETEDSPENNQFVDCINEDEDSIEKINVNPMDAFNKFKDKRVCAKDVDFSDRISSKSKLGYNLCSGEWEHYHKDENETPLQKYQRIQQEIQELRDIIAIKKQNLKENEDSKSLTDLVNQIETTGKELDALNIDKLLSENSVSCLSNFQEVRFKELMSQIKIFKQKNAVESSYPVKEINLPSQESTKSGALKYQMVYYPDKAKIQDMARITHLDTRLGYLETLIGISNNTTKCSQILKSDGIMKSIEKLMANACLLNSTDLDILENKVSSLNQTIDTIIQKKKSILQDSKYETLIQDLYVMVKQYQNSYELLPIVIDRLSSLSNLHRKAAEFGNQLKDLENLQETISASLLNNKTLLEGIQKNFSNNLEIITNDITSLNDRIKKIKN